MKLFNFFKFPVGEFKSLSETANSKLTLKQKNEVINSLQSLNTPLIPIKSVMLMFVGVIIALLVNLNPQIAKAIPLLEKVVILVFCGFLFTIGIHQIFEFLSFEKKYKPDLEALTKKLEEEIKKQRSTS